MVPRSPSSPIRTRGNAMSDVQRCIEIVEAYQVPVGNSAAGEMAAEWTMEALLSVRDEMRKLLAQPAQLEPVGWLCVSDGSLVDAEQGALFAAKYRSNWKPLYTAPQSSQTSPILEPYRMPRELNQGQQEASRAWEQVAKLRSDYGEAVSDAMDAARSSSDMQVQVARLTGLLGEAHKIIIHHGWTTEEQDAYDRIDAAIAGESK